MDVGVDEAGKNVQPMDIDDLPAGSLQARLEGDNLSVRHTDIERLRGCGRDHGSSTQEEIEFRHSFIGERMLIGQK